MTGRTGWCSSARSSFVYGPDGARLKKTVGSTTTLYIGDDWEVNGGVNTFYLPGDAVMTDGVISWLHRDHAGLRAAHHHAAGAVVQRAHYKPYGERLETIATVMTSKGFIGERNDETGLIYLHARYLNPYLGRFITPDPSPDPTAPGVGLDRYAYAGDSPIVNLDKSGLVGVLVGAATGRVMMDPDEVRLSQSSVRVETVAKYAAQYASGEYPDEPADVVKMPDGKLTALEQQVSFGRSLCTNKCSCRYS